MELKAQDFRGRPETIMWVFLVSCSTVVNVVFMICSTLHGGTLRVSEVFVGAWVSMFVAANARTQQSGNERSGSSNAINYAADKLEQATAIVKAIHEIPPKPIVVTPIVAPVAPVAMENIPTEVK